jgi:O-antigen/teichoic acid export membrane protein
VPRRPALPPAVLPAVPPGTLPVGAGVVVLGVSAYAFLAMAGRGLGVERFAVLSVLWVLVFTVGPGLFLPLEQEVARAVAARRAAGQPYGPLVRRTAAAATAFAAATTAVLLLASPVLVPRALGGDAGALAALGLAVWALAAAHLSRGVLAGTGRFGHYGAQLGLEGAVRAGGAALLLGVGVGSVLGYGLLLGGATALAVIVTAGGLSGLREPGPPASLGELSRALGLLFTGAVLSQALVNAGPVLVALLEPPGEQGAAGRFLAAAVLSRVPLLLFAAVQASLLPRLSELAAAGRPAELRELLGRTALAVAGLGLAGVALAAAAGPPLVALLFGSAFDVDRAPLVLLSGATTAFMLGVVLAQACIARERPGAAAAGWAVGVAVLVAATALLPGEAVLRVATASLLGALAALAALAPRAVRG